MGRRVEVVVVSVFGAAIAYTWSTTYLGVLAGAWAAVPAMLAGHLFGKRGGGIVGVLVSVVMTAFSLAVNGIDQFVGVLMTVAGTLTNVGFGVAAGVMSDLRQKLVRLERERVLAESQAKLADAQRLASLGTIAAGIAHEVNNPIAYVRANLRFAIESLESDTFDRQEVLEALRESHDGAERVSNIVTDMRIMSRASGTSDASSDVAASVQRVLSVASSHLKGHATVRIEIPPGLRVAAGESRLGQVLLNLIVNAAQSFADDDVNRNLIIARASGAAGRVTIEIQDNGPGIPEHVRARIFDPFFTTKAPGEGTGLGLSICHSIVDQLGGALTFRTSSTEGTTFVVVLPAATPVQSQDKVLPFRSRDSQAA